MSLDSTSALTASSANSLAIDSRSLNALKLSAGQNSPAAIKETAKQFESLFMRELIKSMREATTKSGLFDSPGENMATDMYDQQLSVSMSGLPGGLSEMIAKQLSKQAGNSSGTNGPSIGPGSGIPSQVAPSSRSSTSSKSNAADFVRQHSDAAKEVERSSGIPSAFMLGQAAHETGWGAKQIRNADGSNAYNLFGIKAGPGWTGKVATVTTTEYVNGKAQKVTAKFRAYDSYKESFQDYAQMINSNPRYATARAHTGSAQAFAGSLQKAGYATDPAYAAKLSRVITAAQQLQRSQA